MKVLFVTLWYPTRSQPQEGSFVRQHARAVASTGAEVAVLHCHGTEAPGSARKFEWDAEDSPASAFPTARMSYRRSRVPAVALGRFVAGTREALRAIEERFRPDIIHAHLYNSAIPVAIPGRSRRPPIVLTEQSSALLAGEVLSTAEYMKARFAYSNVDRVLPVSQRLGEALVSRRFIRRYQVVPNTVDTSLFGPRPMPPRGSQLRFLFVGRLAPVKGLSGLLRALALIGERSDWVLSVVGDGPEREANEALARALGIAHLVRFHRAQPQEEVARQMADAEVVAVPSLRECCSCAAIEALASGRPVLGSPAASNLLGPEDGVVAASTEPLDLAAALIEMIARRGQFDSTAVAARAQRYSLESVGRLFTSVYDECLAHADVQ